MNAQTRYEISPEIIWVNESKGRVLVIDLNKKGNTWLISAEAILWRLIWQGISPMIWEHPLDDQWQHNKGLLNEWIKAGWILEVLS